MSDEIMRLSKRLKQADEAIPSLTAKVKVLSDELILLQRDFMGYTTRLDTLEQRHASLIPKKETDSGHEPS